MRKSSKKKEQDFLTIKEINKKVKEQTPLKEKDPENEYLLTIILKSIVNALYQFSRQLNIGNNSKQELNLANIELYLNQFKEKEYFNIKVMPIIEFLKSYYILSKKEAGFLYIMNDILENFINNKKITNSQIDIINYYLIYRFDKFIKSKESSEFIYNLFQIIEHFNTKEYQSLYEYYIFILLINIYILDLEKNPNKITIIKNILKILFSYIIHKNINRDLSEFAFLLFCEYSAQIENVSLVMRLPSKWAFLILKLLKEEIFLFQLDSEKNYKLYDFIKSFHYKYFLDEVKRNKLRSSFLEKTFLVSVNQNISQHIKLPENIEDAQAYLNDNTYEKFPKELHLPKGPSNNIYKYLYNYDVNFENNKDKYKIIYDGKKKKIIFGVLKLCHFILEKKYEAGDDEYNEIYFSMKLCKELKKIFNLYSKETPVIKLCLYCLGYMMEICPEHLIKYIPTIFQILKNLGNKNNRNFLILSSSLDLFFQKNSEILQKAYDMNNHRIISELNKINKSDTFYGDIFCLIITIFNLPNLRIKKTDKNPEINLTSLLQNTFNLFSIFVNEYFLERNFLTLNVETCLVNLLVKNPIIYLRKYMTTILSKIYNEHVLTSIYNNLFIKESNDLNYKLLFFIFRLLLSEKKNNYLDFLASFLQENITFEMSPASKILEFFSRHITFDNNIFYVSNFKNEEEKYEINNGGRDMIIYSLADPKTNIKLLNYFINIVFLSIKESVDLDDIIFINKLLKMFLLNAISIEAKNVEILMNYLIKYLDNINQSVKEQGHQKNQNNLKKLFELLYYTHFYINIKEYNDILIKNINPQFIIKYYNQVILGTLQLFPNNFNSKEYDFANIIPVIYSYISTIYIYLENDNNQNEQIISNITTHLIESAKNNYNNNIIKHKYHFNSIHLAIFNFFSILKNIDNKNYLIFINNQLNKFLNIEEFKFEKINSDINSLNFILLNIFAQLLNYQETFNQNIISEIIRKKCDILSFIDNKSPFIHHIYKIIKEKMNVINKKTDKNEKSEKKEKTISINTHDEKIKFINENIKFNSKSNFIVVSILQKENIINNNDNKNQDVHNIQNLKKDNVENELLEKNKSFNYNYQLWLTFLMKSATVSKLKKIKKEDEIIKLENLLNSCFSFYQSKIETMIGLIKSEEIDDKDISLFIPFLSNIGEIKIEENLFQYQKENIYNKYIITLNKMNSNDVLIVLIKDNFLEYENSILDGKFIIYIKPTCLSSVYSIKITKNTNNKRKSKNNIKALDQIDNDINKIFSELFLIDFNNETQINYFYFIIDILFKYSLLGQFINIS